MIIREDYLRKLIKFKNKDIIKVVTGIRRCGKSTLFKQYMEYLLSNGVEENQIVNLTTQIRYLDGASFQDFVYIVAV